MRILLTIFIVLVIVVPICSQEQAAGVGIVSVQPDHVQIIHQQPEPRVSSSSDNVASTDETKNDESINKQNVELHPNIAVNQEKESQSVNQGEKSSAAQAEISNIEAAKPKQATLNQQNNQSPPQSPQSSDSVPSSPQASPQTSIILDPESPSSSMASLSEEQKKKLLQQQAIRSAFHNHPQGDFAKFANMTVEQITAAQRQMQQEARRAYEAAMKEMEERERKSAEQLQRLLKEQKLTNTQAISHRQTQEFKERENKFNPRKYEPGRDAYYRYQFNEYMFQIQSKTEHDFSIHLPISQEVALYIYSYTNKNGVYTLTDNLQDQRPAQIHIYENNNRLIINQSFYLKKYITFQGKENYSYTIKIRNEGHERLFALNVVHLLEQTHIAHTADSQTFSNHGQRSQGLYLSLLQQVEQTQRRRVMQSNNSQKLTEGIQLYYLYSVGEMLIFITACVIQIKLIERLLNSGSIV